MITIRLAHSLGKAKTLKERAQAGLRWYWCESARFRDFLALLYLRASCGGAFKYLPRRIVRVNLKTLGAGVHLRPQTTDIRVLREIVAEGQFDTLPTTHPATIIDLGANTGLSYRWLRQRYPSARVVCVEPEPGNLTVLRANVQAARGECIVVPACIGSHERRVGLHSGDGEWGFQMVEAGGDIPVVTMESLLADAAIDEVDLLKCDIEGAEAELFEDCQAWIGRVRAMVVECHVRPTTAESLVEMLATNGGEFELLHVEAKDNGGFEMATLERVGCLTGVAPPS